MAEAVTKLLALKTDVRLSNRPVGVKRYQTVRRSI
jgi:hypothetical protein